LMDFPRVFATTAIVSQDDSFNVDVILDRTVIRGSRISLRGKLVQGEGRRRYIELRSEFIRAAATQDTVG
jgi:hypothetical protein